MFKQMLIVSALMGLVLCEEGVGKNVQPEQGSGPKQPKFGLGENLVDIAIIGGKHAKNALEDAKPTLNNLKETIEKNLSNMRGEKIIRDAWKRGADTFNPKRAQDVVGQVGGKLMPYLDERTKSLIEETQRRTQKLIRDAEETRRKILAEHEQRQAYLSMKQQGRERQDA